VRRKEIEDLMQLYVEFTQSETDRKAKRRLSRTADGLETALYLDTAFKELVAEVEELVACDILDDQCSLAKRIQTIKRSALT